MQSTPSSREIVSEVSGRRPLPDFYWRFDERYGHHWMCRRSDGVEVVAVTQRIPGDWLVTVNRHRWKLSSFRAPTLTRAKAWAAAWAYVHQGRLLVEPKEKFGGEPTEPPDEDD